MRMQWAEADDEYLRLNYGTRTAAELAHDLGCTITAVKYRIRKLGLTKGGLPPGKMRWTAEADEYLRQNFGTCKLSALAAHLGCTQAAVRGRVARLGLRSRTWRPWTPDEERILREGYAVTPVEELAARLGRSARAVTERVEQWRRRQQRRGAKWLLEQICSDCAESPATCGHRPAECLREADLYIASIRQEQEEGWL